MSITTRHLRLFEELYRYQRLDLPTLAYLARDLPWANTTLRRVLYELQLVNCVHVFCGQFGRQPIFALLDRRLAIWLRHLDGRPRRLAKPAHSDAERIRQHDVGLAKFLIARDRFVEAQLGGITLCHSDLFAQTLDDRVRREQRWPVSFAYEGRPHHCHLKPDALTGSAWSAPSEVVHRLG